MKIIIDVDTVNNDGTRSPYWLIIDPRQMMSPNIGDVASMITGPFFSRKEAQDELDRRHYAYSKRAKVYGLSGCYSDQYETALLAGKKGT